MYRRLVEAIQALLENVSITQLKEKEGISLETHNIEEEGPVMYPLKTPGEEKSSCETCLEPRRYPSSHLPKVEDVVVNKLWEELKQGRLEAQRISNLPLRR